MDQECNQDYAPRDTERRPQRLSANTVPPIFSAASLVVAAVLYSIFHEPDTWLVAIILMFAVDIWFFGGRDAYANVRGSAVRRRGASA